MATTRIGLPDELKQRIAQAAAHAGKTPHAFMLAAITEPVRLEERRAALREVAEHRYARVLETGETSPWSAMRDYLKRRLAGKTVAPPAVSKRDAG